MTLPSLFLGSDDYAHSTEAAYRILPAILGSALILLLIPLIGALGKWQTVVAAILLAVSPAMVFYSRYYIHEMALVSFTAAALALGWRYVLTRRAAYAMLAGGSIGLMHATKETFVIAIAAFVWGVLLCLVWARLIDGTSIRPTRPLRWKFLLAAAVLGISISVILFSAFGTNWRGPLDSILTYKTYLVRGSGQNPHDKPFPYYLKLLSWFQYGRGPVTTEAIILFLAVIGFIAALLPGKVSTLAGAANGLERGPHFICFLAFYTLALTTFYSVIPYKTPWCMLSFLHGMILLAGVGTISLLRWLRFVPLRGLALIAIAAGTGHLAYQSWRINFKYPADERRNPYVYSQPSQSLHDLVKTLQGIASSSPRKQSISLIYTSLDIWPLPFYLRNFTNTGQWNRPLAEFPDELYPDILIASPDQREELNKRFGEQYEMRDRNLRPGATLLLLVKRDIWDNYLRSLSQARAQ